MPDKGHDRTVAASSSSRTGAPVKKAEDAVSKEISKGKTLIKKGRALAVAGNVEEARENYVQGLQLMLRQDQTDPRLVAMRKKLDRYVNEAESLEQTCAANITSAAEEDAHRHHPSDQVHDYGLQNGAGVHPPHSRSHADDHDDGYARGRRRRPDQFPDDGAPTSKASGAPPSKARPARRPEPPSKHGEDERRLPDASLRRRRPKEHRRVEGSRSRYEHIPDVAPHSSGDVSEDGLTLRPRVKLVPRAGVAEDSEGSEF